MAHWISPREGGRLRGLPVRWRGSRSGGMLLQRLCWGLLWEDPEGEQTERLGPQHPAGSVLISSAHPASGLSSCSKVLWSVIPQKSLLFSRCLKGNGVWSGRCLHSFEAFLFSVCWVFSTSGWTWLCAFFPLRLFVACVNCSSWCEVVPVLQLPLMLKQWPAVRRVKKCLIIYIVLLVKLELATLQWQIRESTFVSSVWSVRDCSNVKHLTLVPPSVSI